MTEEEYKFLEVIYNRGSIPEQSYINYINGSQHGNMVREEESIEKIFSRFQNSGLIDTNHGGIYRITPLGKEKFEELLSEGKEISRNLENLTLKKTKPFHLSRRVWLALIILVIIVSILTSTIINRWEYLTELFHHLLP
jgi:hypothetical protein